MSSGSLPNNLYILYFDITSELAHFRDPFTHSFFKTLLVPPRTTILGILGAAKGLNEEETINLSRQLYTGVIIRSLDGTAKEIVTAKNLKEQNLTTPVMRTLLVRPVYRIFVGSTYQEIIEDILNAIKQPRYPLYLGISDHLAHISNISGIYYSKCITSDTFKCIVPMYNRLYLYSTFIEQGKIAFMPELNRTVYSFKYTTKGRVPERYINLLMFYNCSVRLNDGSIYAYNINGESICLF